MTLFAVLVTPVWLAAQEQVSLLIACGAAFGAQFVAIFAI